MPNTDTNSAIASVRSESGQTHRVDKAMFLVDGVLIDVTMSEILDCGFESFLDLISERAGFPRLLGISYTIESHHDNTLKLRVKGDVSDHAEPE